jgi:hypothetical protein
MVTLLFTSLFVLILLAIAIYFWQKTTTPSKPEVLPDARRRALFPEGTPAGIALLEADLKAREATEAEQRRRQLFYRAHVGDKATLLEAQADAAVYEGVLNVLTSHTGSQAALLSLVSFITRNRLQVNKALAEKFVDSQSNGLRRSTVAQMLHVAALADDANVFQKAVSLALKAWRSGTLSDITAQELQAILDGEFWILSTSTRSSGSGFLLKRELADARRELNAAHRD